MDDALIVRLLAALPFSQPLAVVDVETTGTMPAIDRVCQVAVLRIEPTGVWTTFASLVNPERPIPPEVSEIHGITDAMVADAPTFAAVMPQVLHLTDGAAICGFNGKFDVTMLGAELQRVGRSNALADAPLIDPFRIFVQREKRDLTAAVKFYTGRDHTDAHDAMADVVAALEVLVGQAERYEDLPRTVAGLAAYCKPTDPSWLDPDGKVIWREGQARLTFGKNAGRSLKELAARDRSFLQWVCAKDFSEDVKALCRNALVGKFPTGPAVKAGDAVAVR